MSSSTRLALLSLLAAAHGVNDFIAGALLGGHPSALALGGRFSWFIVYAALAFGGQLPAAWAVERWARLPQWMGGSLVLMIGAAAIAPFHFGAAILLSGVASAFCHVAGGALALALPRGEKALGWFAAPGILGLTLGGFLARGEMDLTLALLLPPSLLLLGGAAWRDHWPEPAAAEPRASGSPFDGHDGLMLLILLALALRSALWDLLQVAGLADARLLFAIAASAAAGKALGGWAYARWKSPRQLSATLIVSCLLLDFARGHAAGLCAGIALLQSTIPGSIAHLHRAYAQTPARAAAYGFGVTVAAGGLIAPALPSTAALMLALAGSALMLLWRGKESSTRVAAA